MGHSPNVTRVMDLNLIVIGQKHKSPDCTCVVMLNALRGIIVCDEMQFCSQYFFPPHLFISFIKCVLCYHEITSSSCMLDLYIK